MQKTVVAYSITFLLLAIFVNRGLFVIPNEAANQGEREINSVIEWVVEFVTGEGNDIDEDGDMNSDCSFTYAILYDLPQQLVLMNIFPKDIKIIGFLHQETIPFKDFYCQIDHPPEKKLTFND